MELNLLTTLPIKDSVKKFSQGILQILLEQYFNDTYVVSGMLFWKELYYFEE